jgi:hypothetical protein
MTGLAAGTLYRYRVVTGVRNAADTWSPWFDCLGPKTRDAPVAKIIFTGDYGLGGAGPPADEGLLTANAWSKHAAVHDIDLIWVAGDISYANMHGALQFEATWNRWFDALEPAFARVPTMVSVGNHETYLPPLLQYGAVADDAAHATAAAGTDAADDDTAAATTTGAVVAPPGFLAEGGDAFEAGAAGAWNFTAFDTRFKMPADGVRNMWFSAQVGPVHFVSIDTETDFPGAPESFLGGWGDQVGWLESHLASYRAADPTGWLVVIGHKPFYSSESGYTKSGAPAAEQANLIKVFEGLFERYDVALYLSGHQHGYVCDFRLKFALIFHHFIVRNSAGSRHRPLGRGFAAI